MRWRPLLWFGISICCFIGALYFWRLGDRWAGKEDPAQAPGISATSPPSSGPNGFNLTTQPAGLVASSAGLTNESNPLLAYRLANTDAPQSELLRSDTAVLLENAMIDTASPKPLSIPEHLRAGENPGAYLVQFRAGQVGPARAAIERAGGLVVSYIPNNAFLVRASREVAQTLPGVAGAKVIPYEPYFKLKPSLLRLAAHGGAADLTSVLPEGSTLNVLMFADARAETLDEMERLGVELLREQTSPFGPVAHVRPPEMAISTLAGLPGVQSLELARRRVQANDLSRAAMGVAIDPQAQTNYLGLTGTNVVLAMVDEAVDVLHPDLAGRVFMDPLSVLGPDLDGHGTHMAGIMVGSGAESLSVTNVPGSPTPVVEGQFRGKAPNANLFVMGLDTTDDYLQETAARTNILVSNNSWNYDVNDYDLAAASYDAAVRDSLPMRTGSQPVLYVFPAGNGGQLNQYFGGNFESGIGGVSDSILSPGTAKNVITVGAVEQARDITNEVVDCTFSPCVTNALWQPLTDSSQQVAGYSRRGNVGVGIEGEWGRFKPDVVAPGSFILSARSADWDQLGYYNPINSRVDVIPNLSVLPGGVWVDARSIPQNATSLRIDVLPNARSPIPFPTLPIYVRIGGDIVTTNDFSFVTRNNRVVMPPDGGALQSGSPFSYAVGNDTLRPIPFDLVITTFTTNVVGSQMTVLSNLNETVGPQYRFESGTSLAAANVAGTLGLIQEYFEQRLGESNSPALMKALLINGARSLGNLYSLQVKSSINYQGWGQVFLPGSIHASHSNATPDRTSMIVVDQSPANALTTGQRRTYNVALSDLGRELPLRATLVWTDPPGNPVAGVKLVNDLDLVVTNLDTGEVYVGNDILADNDFNAPWSTNAPPAWDTINNVENVFLNPSFSSALGTNFSVTVIGRRVNVNAVTQHPNDIAQDYALVISSGDGEETNALSLVSTPVQFRTEPLLDVITNMFPASGKDIGGILMNQHVGANPALLGTNTIPYGTEGRITLGMTNQWHFYVLTNNTDYTNAAFLTFLPPNLAVPRMGTREEDLENATRPEADIDLYVSQDARLMQLDASVIASAAKSLGQGGTETVVLTNARNGDFYIGVKSEDQQAAEYSILGVVSELPFSTEDEEGNQTLRGFPLPTFIPDGNAQMPAVVHTFGIAVYPIPVRRVIVTNALSHELMGDLVGMLRHSGDLATLYNHTTNLAVMNRVFVFDDSDEQNVVGAQRSDGPGSLMDFGGQEGIGQWMLTQVDNAPPHVGTNEAFGVFLEKQQDPTEGIIADIAAGACRVDYMEVPPDATNLNVTVTIQSGTGPISLELCPIDGLSSDCAITFGGTNGLPAELNISSGGTPALIPGVYSIRVCNLDQDDPIQVRILARVDLNQGVVALTTPSTGGPVRIQDDAITYSTIDINTHQRIFDMDVGMLIRHPRISDLAITLIASDGTRVLLFENRGAGSSTGLGSFLTENGQPVPGVTNRVAVYTGDFDGAPSGSYAPGSKLMDWTVISNIVGVIPDYSVPWRSNHLVVLADGAISNSLPLQDLSNYRLSFEVTHAPYLVGTVGWWPFERDAADIFSGLSGILRGNVAFTNGVVGQAYFGDGSATRMIVDAAPELNVGVSGGLTIEGWINPSNTTSAMPLVQWVNPVNERQPGLQLWLSDLSTNVVVPGAISAALRDVNGGVEYISTGPGVITNAAWQHVALTYDPATLTAQIFINAAPVASQTFTNPVTVSTGGDLYFGYDSTRFPALSYAGGLDEFGLYERVLTECELAAIVTAGGAGKYGTNALTCPVAVQAELTVGGTHSVYTFNHGTNWGAGPTWETNVIEFASATTNPASLVIRSLNPNVAIDNVILSTLRTNSQDGLVHFTDDTNLASLNIKFAPTPFQLTNFGPLTVWASDFTAALPGGYDLGDQISGLGTQQWEVVNGPVTVVSNNILNELSTNSLVLGTGTVETDLPTEAGRRYRMTYRLRGPGAVSWWNGDVNPLNRRAFDLLGGNDGAFIGGAQSGTGLVSTVFAGRTPTSLFFEGLPTNGLPSKIELGDPQNLWLTNSFTIEGWILPLAHTNDVATEQILFRGDARDCLDPYYLALQRVDTNVSELRFHIEGAGQPGCGVDLVTTGGLISRAETNWYHVAAVFESGATVTAPDGTNTITLNTNQMRLYVNGELVASQLTGVNPLRELDPAYSPGIAIGNRSRNDYSEPFHGFIDELTVYGRALTDPEILAIGTNSAGKADLSVPMHLSLSRLAVALDNTVAQTSSGDNADWTSHTFVFTARGTNTLLSLRGLLPGTIVDSVALAEVPGELSYLPEQALEILRGKDSFGEWRLEIWDNRAGQFVSDPTLVTWQLDFRLLPMTPPTPLALAHGIPHSGTIPPGNVQTFVINVPQWAERATNVLLFAEDQGGNPLPLGVLYGSKAIPTSTANALFWPPVAAGTNVLTTAPGSQQLIPGQAYYLSVTNPNPVTATFSFGVWYDITTLNLCEPQNSFVRGAGIPRYFQFDVPTNGASPDVLPKAVAFWLTGVNTNVTVVLSQSLPLPDLDNYDYLSQAPSTNDEIALVVTNSTPFPLQTNRWYVGVFNSREADVPFTVEACYQTEYPTLIPLTADVPVIVNATNALAAPPGPPRWFFYTFEVTNNVAGVLFELYGLTGDADLILEREVPPTVAPYFRTSYSFGTNSEQIVLRPSSHTPDLPGRYILGIYNNEPVPTGYIIRAAVTETNGLLVPGELPRLDVIPMQGMGPLLGWNAVVGEDYTLQFSPSLLQAVWTNIAQVTATTPYATYQVATQPPFGGYYRVIQGIYVPPQPPNVWLKVARTGTNEVRISWSTNLVDWRLQYSDGNFVDWREWDTNAHPILIDHVLGEYVTTDEVYDPPRYYRLWQGPMPPQPVLITNLIISVTTSNTLRIEWPTNLVDYRLQYAEPDFVWHEWPTNTNPITVEGTNYVTFDAIYAVPRFYRLFQGVLPPVPPVNTNLVVTISPTNANLFRLEWSTNLVNHRLQYAEPDFVWKEWPTNTNPITIEGSNYVTFDTRGPIPRWYRLFAGAQPPSPPLPVVVLSVVGTNMNIMWPAVPPGLRLQYTDDTFATWNEWDTNANPVVLQGTNYLTTDLIRNTPRFYRVVGAVAPPSGPPSVTFRKVSATQIQLTWPTTPPGWRLEYTEGDFTTWLDWSTTTNVVTVEGLEHVTYDEVGTGVPRFYRLVFEAAPPSGPPVLSFDLEGTNTIRIVWPIVSGYKLQYTEGNFLTWSDWDTNANPVSVSGTNYVTTDSIGTTVRFYRLVKEEPLTPATPPTVSVIRMNETEMQISWPAGFQNYRLQTSDGDLVNWDDWDIVASPIRLVGDSYLATDSIGAGAKFYRLVGE